MKKVWIWITLTFLVIISASCVRPPSTFVRTYETGFKEIQLKEGISKDDAWNTVVDIVSKKFDIEVLEKKDDYLRSGWAYYTTGELEERYRVRITIKFFEGSKLTIKTEAQWLGNTGWELGYDLAVLQDVSNDITGKIGRIIK
jgi:hypothetical protein